MPDAVNAQIELELLMNNLARSAGALIVAVVLTGCTAPPQDAGFDAVQNTVADRTGAAVQWRGRSQSDAWIDKAVDQILSQPMSPAAAVQVALLNNWQVQAWLADLGIARADLVQAGLLSNPVLSIGVRFPDRAPRGTYLQFSADDDLADLLFLSARKHIADARFQETRATSPITFSIWPLG